MSREEGFTLVEALLALTLGAFLVTTVLAAVRLGSEATARSRVAASLAEAESRAGDVIAGDALHALALRSPEGPLFSGGPRSVAFAMAPRPEGHAAGAPPVLLRYDLHVTAHGSELLRSEAALDARARPRAFGPPVTIWQAAGGAEFRFLDIKGRWLRTWPKDQGMPAAFALDLPGDNGIPRLAGRFLDLVEPACARGPGPECSLAPEAFP